MLLSSVLLLFSDRFYGNTSPNFRSSRVSVDVINVGGQLEELEEMKSQVKKVEHRCAEGVGCLCSTRQVRPASQKPPMEGDVGKERSSMETISTSLPSFHPASVRRVRLVQQPPIGCTSELTGFCCSCTPLIGSACSWRSARMRRASLEPATSV